MTPFDLAQRFVGEIAERPGVAHHPWIQWAHELSGLGVGQPDETAWCSSFVNAIAWMCRRPRSKSAAARSWLAIGVGIELEHAVPGFDVVVLSRGPAPFGHVGFYAGHANGSVRLLGGNQSNAVTFQEFPFERVLGIRRL